MVVFALMARAPAMAWGPVLEYDIYHGHHYEKSQGDSPLALNSTSAKWLRGLQCLKEDEEEARWEQPEPVLRAARALTQPELCGSTVFSD